MTDRLTEQAREAARREIWAAIDEYDLDGDRDRLEDAVETYANAAAEARTPPGEWYSRAALDHAVAEAVGALTMDDDAAGKWWWQSTAIAANWPETEAWDLMPQPMKNVFIHHGQAALAALRQRTATSVTPPPTGADTAGLRAALDAALEWIEGDDEHAECLSDECSEARRRRQIIKQARAALAPPTPKEDRP
jgi:hypothetical protein